MMLSIDIATIGYFVALIKWLYCVCIFYKHVWIGIIAAICADQNNKQQFRSQYEIVYDECELVIPRQANTHTSYVEYGLSAGLIIQLAKWYNF